MRKFLGTHPTHFFRGENLWTLILIFFVIGILLLPEITVLSFNMSVILIGFSIALFFLISLFLWSQKPHDEREEFERLKICKYKTIGGEYVLMLIIIYQAIINQIDLTLIIILVVMLASKLFLMLYNRVKNKEKI